MIFFNIVMLERVEDEVGKGKLVTFSYPSFGSLSLTHRALLDARVEELDVAIWRSR